MSVYYLTYKSDNDKNKAIWNRFVHTVSTFATNVLTAVSSFENAVSKEDINKKAERILDRHGNAILRMAYSYLHNRSDAEDILQETLLKYIQTVPEFSGSEHEKAWLLCVAANLSKNRIKYNTIRHTDELNEELQSEDREDLSFVWEAVKSLPAKYKEVVHLHYYEGYSTKQIAEILARNESTVRSDLKRGRENLKAILKEAYDFEE